jgi:SAM-dependent methyltransferase
MHQGVVDWVRSSVYGDMIDGKRVLDVGSLNWNGSMRGYFLENYSPQQYHGIDIRDGVDVDEVVSANELLETYGPKQWDLILCLEMLEHCDKWQDAIYQMKESLTEGGWLILTTRSPGYPYHAPPDRWRFTKEVLREAFSDLEEVGTWSDPGHSEEWSPILETRHTYQPGVFIRGRRGQGELSMPTLEAEPAPSDLNAIPDPMSLEEL